MQRSTPVQYVASSQSESALHVLDVSRGGVVASAGPSSSPHARIEESTQTTQSFDRIEVEDTRRRARLASTFHASFAGGSDHATWRRFGIDEPGTEVTRSAHATPLPQRHRG